MKDTCRNNANSFTYSLSSRNFITILVKIKCFDVFKIKSSNYGNETLDYMKAILQIPEMLNFSLKIDVFFLNLQLFTNGMCQFKK